MAGLFTSIFADALDVIKAAIYAKWNATLSDVKEQHGQNAVAGVCLEILDFLFLFVIWVITILTTPFGIVTTLFIVIVWGCMGERYGSRVYELLCGQIHCPDVRDSVACGLFPMGWCIMDLCCPCVCPKYKPDYAMRVVIEKATHLHYSWAKHAGQPMDVYIKVWAGTNPIKTTSIRQFVPRSVWSSLATSSGDNLQSGAPDIAVWNEPIDLAMAASIRHLDFEIFERAFIGGDQRVGSCRVKIDGIYESPGECSKLVCGRQRCCGPRGLEICGMTFGPTPVTEWDDDDETGRCSCCRPRYHWPKVVGAQSAGRQSQYLMLSGRNHKVKEVAPSAVQKKGQALECVSYCGENLKDLESRWKEDEEVVLAAVRSKGEAIQYASEDLQRKPHIERAAMGIPEPMLVTLTRRGEDAGILYVYFVLSDMDEPLDLPYPFGDAAGFA